MMNISIFALYNKAHNIYGNFLLHSSDKIVIDSYYDAFSEMIKLDHVSREYVMDCDIYKLCDMDMTTGVVVPNKLFIASLFDVFKVKENVESEVVDDVQVDVQE